MGDLEIAILRSNRGRCIGCGVPADRVDHVKPCHAGGLTVPENLCPLCDLCNKTKSCMWPGHGYHPVPGHNDPSAAAAILHDELEYLVDIYGESRLLEAIGPDALDPHLESLESRGKRRDAWRYEYMHLTEALSIELGSRAFGDWCQSLRGPAWRHKVRCER